MTTTNNPLTDLYYKHEGKVMVKWHHYLDIYHRHFEQFRAVATPANPIILWEIGVENGGSLDMWLKYFGKENCVIYGIDINPKCLMLMKGLDPNIHIVIGDQGNLDFLKNLTATLPPPHIIIDDGGHYPHQQKNSFQILFPFLRPGGVYVCEDCHTSYWPDFYGGVKQAGTFVEYSKDLIDSINSYHHRPPVTSTCYAMHVYDSVFVFDKVEPQPPPTYSIVGTEKIIG